MAAPGVAAAAPPLRDADTAAARPSRAARGESSLSAAGVYDEQWDDFGQPRRDLSAEERRVYETAVAFWQWVPRRQSQQHHGDLLGEHFGLGSLGWSGAPAGLRDLVLRTAKECGVHWPGKQPASASAAAGGEDAVAEEAQKKGGLDAFTEEAQKKLAAFLPPQAVSRAGLNFADQAANYEAGGLDMELRIS